MDSGKEKIRTKKINKNVHYNFPKQKCTYSNCLFCLTYSPKPNLSILSLEKQGSLSFKCLAFLIQK